MARCEDFYKKWEGNPNWCEKCDETVRRIDLYVDLVKEHPPIGGISEGATRPLFRIKDEKIRTRAIANIEKALTPRRRDGKAPKLTTKDVESIINDSGDELRNERTYGSISKDGRVEVDEVRPEPRTEAELNAEIRSEDVRLRALQEPSSVIVYTVTQAEIDSYFEVMTKIGCTGDMPRHKSRIKTMLEEGILRIVTIQEE